MAEWREYGGGHSINIGQWEIFVSPNRPPHGWNAMILTFHRIIHRVDKPELEQAKQSALTTLIAMLDEWRTQAEAARVALDEATQ